MNAVVTSKEATPPAPVTLKAPWPALLGPMSPADAEAMEALANPRQCPEGSVIFRRDAAALDLVALVDGQVACGWWQDDRGLSVDRVVHAPAWLDLAGPWVGGRHGIDAVAQSAAWLIDLPLAPLRAMVAQRPLLSLRLADALAKEAARLECRVHALMHKDAGARLAAWICDQSAGRSQPTVLRLSERKRDIASQLGMTPETLSRLMRTLSDRELIAVSGYQLRVLDPQGLRALAGS